MPVLSLNHGLGIIPITTTSNNRGTIDVGDKNRILSSADAAPSVPPPVSSSITKGISSASGMVPRVYLETIVDSSESSRSWTRMEPNVVTGLEEVSRLPYTGWTDRNETTADPPPPRTAVVVHPSPPSLTHPSTTILPLDLRMVLLEVARTGKSSRLPWSRPILRRRTVSSCPISPFPCASTDTSMGQGDGTRFRKRPRNGDKTVHSFQEHSGTTSSTILHESSSPRQHVSKHVASVGTDQLVNGERIVSNGSVTTPLDRTWNENSHVLDKSSKDLCDKDSGHLGTGIEIDLLGGAEPTTTVLQYHFTKDVEKDSEVKYGKMGDLSTTRGRSLSFSHENNLGDEEEEDFYEASKDLLESPCTQSTFTDISKSSMFPDFRSSSPMTTAVSDQYSSSSNIDTHGTSLSTQKHEQEQEISSSLKYYSIHTLRDAFRLAVTLVLDYVYQNQGGYKMSPAEKRRLLSNRHTTSEMKDNLTKSFRTIDCDARTAFVHRRNQLLRMLSTTSSHCNLSKDIDSHHYDTHRHSQEQDIHPKDPVETIASGFKDTNGQRVMNSTSPRNRSFDRNDLNHPSKLNEEEEDYHDNGPPFTMQRLAEVLLSPERYYQQTHKLCNALEKLLLVTSPSTAFGGVTGGETSQNTREEEEIIALADAKDREETEHRHRRLKRRAASDVSDKTDTHSLDEIGDNDSVTRNVTEGKGDLHNYSSYGNPLTRIESSPTTFLLDSFVNAENQNLACKPTSLPVSCSSPSLNDLTNQTMTLSSSHDESEEKGDLTRQYPPSIYKNVDKDNYSGEQSLADGVSRYRREHIDGINVIRPASPMLLTAQSSPSNASVSRLTKDSRRYEYTTNMDSLYNIQSHQSATLTTTSLSAVDNGRAVQLEIMVDASSPSSSSIVGGDFNDLYVDPGRSSASNSDFDSESGDDTSLDDSASDKSDGSEGYNVHMGLGGIYSGYNNGHMYYEPSFQTAARVMAFNRVQHQQRREQYILQNRALHQHPCASSALSDSDYQSGDSIDSMIAEDSEGSESSSSDLAD